MTSRNRNSVVCKAVFATVEIWVSYREMKLRKFFLQTLKYCSGFELDSRANFIAIRCSCRLRDSISDCCVSSFGQRSPARGRRSGLHSHHRSPVRPSDDGKMKMRILILEEVCPYLADHFCSIAWNASQIEEAAIVDHKHFLVKVKNIEPLLTVTQNASAYWYLTLKGSKNDKQEAWVLTPGLHNV